MVSVAGRDFLLGIQRRRVEDLVFGHQRADGVLTVGAFDGRHGATGKAARAWEPQFEFQAGSGRGGSEGGVGSGIGRHVGLNDGFDLQLGRVRSLPSFPMLLLVLLVTLLLVFVLVVLVVFLATIALVSLLALMSLFALGFRLEPRSNGGGIRTAIVVVKVGAGRSGWRWNRRLGRGRLRVGSE